MSHYVHSLKRYQHEAARNRVLEDSLTEDLGEHADEAEATSHSSLAVKYQEWA